MLSPRFFSVEELGELAVLQKPRTVERAVEPPSEV
jgi:hypothetical protein